MLQCDSECARRTLAPCTDSGPDTYRPALDPISSCLSLTCGIVCVCSALAEALLSSPAALLFFLCACVQHAAEFRPCDQGHPAPRGNSQVVASRKPACLCRSSFCCSLGRRLFHIATANSPPTATLPHTHTPPYPTPPPISPQVCCLLRSSLSTCNACRARCRVTATLFFNLEGVA